MLVDPLSLGVVRTAYPVETKTFTNLWKNADGSEIKISLTLSCRYLDNSDGYVALDQANAARRRYLGENPETIDLGGRPIAMSAELCQAVANVLVAQDGAEWYSFEALARYAILLDTVWSKVVVWAASIGRTEKDEEAGTPDGVPMTAFAAIVKGQPHPDLVHHFSSLLRSINDRLSGGQGQNVSPLVDHWVADVIRVLKAEEKK